MNVDGQRSALSGGDIVFVPTDSELRVDGGNEDAVVWVTTLPGTEAVLADGTRFSPPWAA